MDHFSSRFVWHQHFTPDVAKAKAFYAALFGWRYRMLLQAGVQYAVIRQGRQEIGGMAGIESMNLDRPCWVPLASSADVDADIDLAESVGAECVLPPLELGDIGYVGAFRDPQGALVMMVTEELPSETRLTTKQGAFYWNELATTDAEVAKIFYGKIMHWKPHSHDMGDVGVYTIFRDPAGGTRDTAGMHQIPPGYDEPPRWTSYIAVDSCEEVIERALELDGAVTVPPTTVPGIGRFAMLTDSQDAPFAIIEVGSGDRRSSRTSGRRRKPSGRHRAK